MNQKLKFDSKKRSKGVLNTFKLGLLSMIICLGTQFAFANSNTILSKVELGDKWDNGTLILKPADDSLKSKEMPIDTFFHKIVMIRDRVRVMEQRINSSKLTDEEKVNLEQYITRIYGSLTTFNVFRSSRKATSFPSGENSG